MPGPIPATKTPAQSQPAPAPRPVPAPRLPTVAAPAVRLAPAARGEPLLTPVRARLEGSFGVDLGAVRVHQDSGSQQTAKQMGARAFAYGPNIVLGPRERPDDLSLMAHEAAHVVQQGSVPALQGFSASSSDTYEIEAEQASAAVLQGQSFTVQQQTSPRTQALLGVDLPNPLNWLAGKANIIPGFRMFTIILGVNPINMSRVERSAANILKALIEFLPGGGLITQALESHGVFEQAGTFIEAQIATLGMTGSAIKAAVTAFIDGLSLRRILTEPGSVWDSAKRIFTEPIDRIIAFAKGTVKGIIKLIKDAILKPLAKFAEGTKGYDLLKAVLGEDPVTGEKVPRTAETLIGGFMKLIGQEEIWENVKKGNAIPRAWAWFQGALSGLMGFVRQIPTLFVSAFKALEIADIILVPRAFAKIAGVFGSFIGQFLSWAGNTMWNLLQIIFEVVAPAVMPYLKKAAAAFRTILKNPIGFVGNLVRAGKLGFELFAGNFLEHLKAALIRWITGPLGDAGVYIPKSFSLLEVVKLVLSVLGLTWQNIRTKLVKIIPEPVLVGLEKTASILVTLVKDGPVAAWEQIKTELSELKDQMIAQITQMVTMEVIKAAVKKLVMMLNPAGAFVQAVIAIYNTITFFIEKINQIAAVVASFIDSVSAIAAGQVGNAAKKVEQTMANTLTVVIAFLAKFAGLGDIPNKVVGVIKKIRQPIDKGLDKIVGWLGTLLKKAGTAVLQAGMPQDPVERLRLGVQAALTAANRFAGQRVGVSVLRPLLGAIRIRYGFQSLDVVPDGNFWAVEAVINPKKRERSQAQREDSPPERREGIDPEPIATINFSTNEIQIRFGVLDRQFNMNHSLQRHHYLFLVGNSRPESQNSLLHHDVSSETVRQDGLNLGRNLQGKLRRDLRARISVEGRYNVNSRAYLVDRPNHFFVVSGAQVWGGISRRQWEAARLLRLVEQEVISPERIRRMVPERRVRLLIESGRNANEFERRIPLVNAAANALRDANAYLALGIISGRADLVSAFLDLNRNDE